MNYLWMESVLGCDCSIFSYERTRSNVRCAVWVDLVVSMELCGRARWEWSAEKLLLLMMKNLDTQLFVHTSHTRSLLICGWWRWVNLHILSAIYVYHHRWGLLTLSPLAIVDMTLYKFQFWLTAFVASCGLQMVGGGECLLSLRVWEYRRGRLYTREDCLFILCMLETFGIRNIHAYWNWICDFIPMSHAQYMRKYSIPYMRS